MATCISPIRSIGSYTAVLSHILVTHINIHRRAQYSVSHSCLNKRPSTVSTIPHLYMSVCLTTRTHTHTHTHKYTNIHSHIPTSDINTLTGIVTCTMSPPYLGLGTSLVCRFPYDCVWTGPDMVHTRTHTHTHTRTHSDIQTPLYLCLYKAD